MEQETPAITRKNWEIVSAEHQREVNELLNDLQPEIDMINLNLAKLTSENTQEELTDYCTEALKYLNKKWESCSGEAFLVSGQMYLPEVEATPFNISYQPEKVSNCMAAYSQGFTVSPVDFNQHDSTVPEYKVGMMFAQPSNMQVDTPWMFIQCQPRILAQPHEISLQYLRPSYADVVSGDIDEVKDSITRVDAILQLYLKSRYSNFYKISGKKQEKFILSMINSVNDVLPAPETNDTVRITNAQTQELVIRGFNPDEGTVKFTEPQEPFNVDGFVKGVTVLDFIDSEGQQITSPDNLDENSFGLSLIVSPYSINHEIEGYDDQDVIIPLSQLMSCNFELV